MKRFQHYLFFVALAAAVYGPLFASLMDGDGPRAGFAPAETEPRPREGPPLFSAALLFDAFPTEMSHAPTAVEARNGDLLVAWYGGSGEAEPDVGIYLARRPREGSRWSDPVRIVDRQTAQNGHGGFVWSVGNPVLVRGDGERLWLFYVATVSGWSTAWIEVATSDDHGRTWSDASRLYAAPGFNFSSLTRNPAIPMTDGTFLLPAYHELIGKYGLALRLEPDGTVIDRARMPSAQAALQPALVPFDDRSAHAFLRPAAAPYRVLTTRTDDAGWSWAPVSPSDLVSPSAPAAALRTGSDEILLAFNDHPQWRANIALSLSVDGAATWADPHIVDARPEDWTRTSPDRDYEVGYPWLMRDAGGRFHLFYSYARDAIKHVQFNDAWLARAFPK